MKLITAVPRNVLGCRAVQNATAHQETGAASSLSQGERFNNSHKANSCQDYQLKPTTCRRKLLPTQLGLPVTLLNTRNQFSFQSLIKLNSAMTSWHLVQCSYIFQDSTTSLTMHHYMTTILCCQKQSLLFCRVIHFFILNAFQCNQFLSIWKRLSSHAWIVI